MTKKEAINILQSLQANGEGANVHAEADMVLCDFLDASAMERSHVNSGRFTKCIPR